MFDLSRLSGPILLAVGSLIVCGLCFKRATEEIPDAPSGASMYERDFEIDPVYPIVNWADDPDALKTAIKGRPRSQLVNSGVLELATSLLHEGQVRVLLDAGVPPEGTGENQPIYLACRQGNERIVDLLLARGAKLEPPGANPRRRTPLFAAIASGSIPTVARLLRAGASLDRKYIISVRRYTMLTTQELAPSAAVRPPGGGFGDGPFVEVTARSVLQKRNDKFAREVLRLAKSDFQTKHK